MKFFALIVSACVLTSAEIAKADQEDQFKALKASISELKSAVADLQTKLNQQQEVISNLSKENQLLKISENAQKTSTSTPIPQTPAAINPKSSGYLPEIGLVADIVGLSTKSKEDSEGRNRFSARDVELIIGHDVDPYSRLDATITFSDAEDPSLEEAYATFWDLPLDSKLRFGRIKPKIGKAAAIHRDSLDTVDVPFVVQRYFGAEGLSKTGLDLSAYTPLSADGFTQEFSVGFLEGGGGEDGQLFGETKRIPTIYAHLKNTLDFSELTNSELGATFLNGSSDSDSGREASMFGVDLSLNHFVTPRNKLKILAEGYLRNHQSLSDTGVDLEGEPYIINHSSPFGYYALADYRFAERWGFGGRWDWVQPIRTSSEQLRDAEKGISGYLTFFQSEFARWRFEYQHAWLDDGFEDDRLYLQGTFAIGTHKHPLQ